MTQSAITKSVADLEVRLGYLLFHRTSRGALLTEEGREFVERASRAIWKMPSDLLQPASKEDPFSGALSIGICPASMEWCLIKPLTALIARHFNIRLDISGSTIRNASRNNCATGRLDVAVGYDAAFRANGPTSRARPCPTSWPRCLVRKAHPILDGRKITAREISAYDFVASSETSRTGLSFAIFYESQGIAWQKRLHTVDYFPLVESIVLKTIAIERIVAASPRKVAPSRAAFPNHRYVRSFSQSTSVLRNSIALGAEAVPPERSSLKCAPISRRFSTNRPAASDPCTPLFPAAP